MSLLGGKFGANGGAKQRNHSGMGIYHSVVNSKKSSFVQIRTRIDRPGEADPIDEDQYLQTIQDS